jgi:hypothetical protein
MQFVNVNDRVSTLVTSDSPQISAEETAYVVEVEPDELASALMEPSEILRANGVNVPDNALLFANASHIQRTINPQEGTTSGVKAKIKIRINIDIVIEKKKVLDNSGIRLGSDVQLR